MKNILRAAVLSLAALAFSAPAAMAGTFGLFTCGGHCCKGCCFCIRPYNAFSPVCCGSVTMDGAGFANGGGGLQLNYGGLPAEGCGCAMAPMAPSPAMAMYAPMPPAAPYAVPQAPPGPYYGVQPAGYYMPVYYPAFNYAPQMPIYGNR
jgi:hypothetical protein